MIFIYVHNFFGLRRARLSEKKSWNQLAPYFSFLVARRNILVAKNYLKKVEYNVLKVFK